MTDLSRRVHPAVSEPAAQEDDIEYTQKASAATIYDSTRETHSQHYRARTSIQSAAGQRQCIPCGRSDSGLGIADIDSHSYRVRSPTPDLTASVSSMQTEEEMSDSNETTLEVTLGETKSAEPLCVAQPVPKRPGTNMPLAALQAAAEDAADAANTSLDHQPIKVSAECTSGTEPATSAVPTTRGNSALQCMTTHMDDRPAGIKAACYGSSGSGGRSGLDQEKSSQQSAPPSHRNQFSRQSYGTLDEQDPSIGRVGDAEELSEAPNGESGFCCVFHVVDHGRDPTPYCCTRKRFVSQLKRHHIHSDHPGGPFGCCSNCFVTGVPLESPSTGIQEFVRFKSLDEVSAHEKKCKTYICIQEDCDNYDRVTHDAKPCKHKTKYSGLQIWRMWFKRAHNVVRVSDIPEPSRATGVIVPTSTPEASRPLRLLTPSPSTPVRPTSGASSAQSIGRFSDDRSIASMSSPMPGLLTSSSSPMAVSRSSQYGLERFARELLGRVRSGNFQWSDTLSHLYNSTMRAALLRYEKTVDTEPDAAERIHSTQVFITLCRNTFANAASRTSSNWSDLRTAAAVTLLIDLPFEPPSGWLPSREYDHTPSFFFNSSVEIGPQTANLGGAFDNSLMHNFAAPNYPTTLSMQDDGMEFFGVGPNVQSMAHVHTAGDTFAQNTLDPRLSMNMQAGAGSDAQSTSSAAFGDSGVYTWDSSSDYSGNGKSSRPRRQSMLRHAQSSS